MAGQWNGSLAVEFGLEERVTEEQFTRLADGQDPRDGRQIIRQVKAHERAGRDGEIRKTVGHRAGVDIAFSAPKSVTLVCVVGGDERLRELHRQANAKAMGEVEKNLQARLGGRRAAETTGKAVIATFEHDAARPDRKMGYAAPDLHSHNFVFNVTVTGDGKIKSVDMAELYRAQKKGTAVYRAELANGLQRLGYEIRIDERTGAPEIQGISREYIEASSPRQIEIKETAERMRAEGKQLGMVREDGSTSTRVAATVNRRTKVFDREEMKSRHQEIEAKHGGQAKRAVEAARMRVRVLDETLLYDAQESRMAAREAVTFAIAKLSEREELNRLIHDARRDDNQIGKDERTTGILRNRNELTGAERTFSGAYREGDIIRFNTNSKAFGVQAGEYARVEAVNRASNILTVGFTREGKAESGRRMNYDPKRLQGVSVYEAAEIKVAEGERVQFRAPARKQRISNGELGTIERIERDKWTIKLDTNRRVFVSPGENPHLDYGYAVTSHSAQGQTVNRVLINMNTRESDVLLNQRMAYVAASGMRGDVRIYTDSTDNLSEALARQVDKSIALEAAKGLPHERSANKEQINEQRETQSIIGADRTGESRDVATPTQRDATIAGRIATTERSATIKSEATIVRHLSNDFDRGTNRNAPSNVIVNAMTLR